jgi:hypothetical protein
MEEDHRTVRCQELARQQSNYNSQIQRLCALDSPVPTIGLSGVTQKVVVSSPSTSFESVGAQATYQHIL